MNADQHLKDSEEKWLSSSFEFLKNKFIQTPLPSHDHFHHLRVWNHARTLISALAKQGLVTDYNFIESLLLSSMFHDSGMIKETGSEHGSAGVEVLHEFLEKSNIQPVKIEAISEAIEKHDNKTYALAGKLVSNGNIMLLPALQISDDLDALGYIGIFRYTEIYLLRGIPFEDLGLKIIANLSGRYGNFMANCSRLPEMIKIHSMRHHTIENFFRLYNLQIRKYEKTGENQKTGPIAVVKNIYKEVLKNTPSIEHLSDNILNVTKDAYIINFFKALKREVIL